MKPDLIIEGNLVDIFSRVIYPASLEIINGIIYKIDRLRKSQSDFFILPPFVDSHIHIESSLLVPSEFSRVVTSFGTVATVSDPHEIANVLGIDGVQFMIKNGKQSPFKFYFGAPSCVPAIDFENSGAKLSPMEIELLLKQPEIHYLSEMMNFPGVINQSPEVIEKLSLAQKYCKPVDGHSPGLRGTDLLKYISAGITTDHETLTLEEAVEKIHYGMKILIREGSAAKNFEELHPLIKMFPDSVMFCSDDKHPDDLIESHINELVKRSLNLGYDLFDVLQIASLNPIKHYNLDVGLLRVGDDADFIIIDNLNDFNILKTYIQGNLVAENGKSLIPKTNSEKPNKFNCSYKNPDDFKVERKGNKILVIKAIDGELFTDMEFFEINSNNKYIDCDIEADILKLVVVNRYIDSNPSVAFIKNFGLKQGAIASSVSHDSHNIIAVGTNDKDLSEAINIIVENKGGLAVTFGNYREILPLPIAGIMTDEDAYYIAERYKLLQNKAKKLGSHLKSPFMTLSFMALPVIPKLKLTDKGLFDVSKFEFTELQF